MWVTNVEVDVPALNGDVPLRATYQALVDGVTYTKKFATHFAIADGSATAWTGLESDATDWVATLS